MPSGIYKREGTGNGFQKGHLVLGGFQKGNKIGRRIKKGEKLALGKRWKVKDTSKKKGRKIKDTSKYKGGKKGRKIKDTSKWKTTGNGFQRIDGTIRNYPYDWTEILRESIRERDNHICQECGLHQDKLGGCYKKLDVHHTDYNKNNLDPENLITLCRSCHIKTNNNRAYWIEYFQEK